MLRILIADDHSIVRSGLKQIIASEIDLDVAGEASQGSEILSRLRLGGIDVLLTDLSMPGLSNLDLISRVRSEAPDVPILVLSMHNEVQLVSRVLRSGAAGYVTKDCAPSTLLAAIRKVGNGGRFIDPCLTDAMIFDPRDDSSPHARLTNREFAVLKFCSEGLSLTEIGEMLHLSAKTVSTYKTRLMQKLGIENNADLVRYALRHGLIME